MSLICINCAYLYIFTNASFLHNHCLEEHGYNSHSLNANQSIQEANAYEHAFQNNNVYIISTHGYAVAEIYIDNLQESACLDTESGVSLINCHLLEALAKQDLSYIQGRPIVITGIGSCQLVYKHTQFTIELVNHQGQVIPIEVEAYILDNLKAGLILGNNNIHHCSIDLLTNGTMQVNGIEL